MSLRILFYDCLNVIDKVPQNLLKILICREIHASIQMAGKGVSKSEQKRDPMALSTIQ